MNINRFLLLIKLSIICTLILAIDTTSFSSEPKPPFNITIDGIDYEVIGDENKDSTFRYNKDIYLSGSQQFFSKSGSGTDINTLITDIKNLQNNNKIIIVDLREEYHWLQQDGSTNYIVDDSGKGQDENIVEDHETKIMGELNKIITPNKVFTEKKACRYAR